MGLLEQKTTDFIEALASAAPVPGGGGVSATVGAFAAALGSMVANLTIGKKKYEAYEETVKDSLQTLGVLQKNLIALTDADAVAFEPLSNAYRLPKNTPEEIAYRDEVMEAGLLEASSVPLDIMTTVLQVMEQLDILLGKTSVLAISDIGVGGLLAQAALESAALNVYINTKLMKNRAQAEEMNHQAAAMIQTGAALKEKIYAATLAALQ